MALDVQGVMDTIASYAMATGYFDAVLGYVSKQQSTNGITAALYVEDIRAIRTSGLDNTTVRVEIEMQIYSSTYQEPYDGIDINLTLAADAVFTALVGDFNLGSASRNIDVFGTWGQPLRVRSGFMNLDGKEFRVFQVTIPVVIDDVWPQAA